MHLTPLLVALTVALTLPAATRAQTVVPEPIDPVAAEVLRNQQQLQRESERVFEALRRNDRRRADLADIVTDQGVQSVILDGHVRLQRLEDPAIITDRTLQGVGLNRRNSIDEAEVERLRAMLRADRIAREDAVRRRDMRP
ncbi:MAG: hypothetical protein WCZ23_05550 [Rhodospirillaceae bacterium]